MVTELTNSVKKSYFRPIASHTTKTVAEKMVKPKKEKEKIVIEDSTCPKCKEHKIMKGKTAYGCANFKACGFMIPFEIGGKKLTDNQIHQLLTKQKTTKIKGFVDANTNEKFDAKLILDTMFKLDFER